MSMKTLEYRFGGAVAMLFVACLPLFCVGYGAVFAGCVLSKHLRKERRRRQCEKIRNQRIMQRLALREARKNEQRGENWIALRNAKGALASRTPSKDARINVLKNNVFENTDVRDGGGVTAEEVAGQWDRTHDAIGEMVRFGLMLLEIEATVDSSVIMGEDAEGVPVIVGRNPGVRGWLAEHCPHIGYKTAMRYKSLARKALQSKKGVALVAKGETVHAVQESLYADLGIPHCRLEKPRAKRKTASRATRHPVRRRTPCQSLIFATRTRTHDTLGVSSVQEAQRLGAAFLSLAHEVCGAG